MIKKTLLVVMLFSITFISNGQKLNMEKTYEFKSIKKDSYLGDVSYDPATKTTKLVYVENELGFIRFKTYLFDENLEFISENEEKYGIKEAVEDLANSFKEFPWFKYRGESYTESMVYVNKTMNGKINAKKYTYSYNWNWNLGLYIMTWKPDKEKIVIEAADNERLYLYDLWNSVITGDLFLLTGLKAPKGDKSAKWQHTTKYQIIRISKDLQVEELETIEFDYAMSLSYMGVLRGDREILVEGESDVLEIGENKMGIVFSPVKSMLAKKMMDPNPSNQVIVVINPDGSVSDKINIDPPTSGWVIEDYAASAYADDFYFYGPAKNEEYVNKLKPTNSPLSGTVDVKDIKYKNFQIMKFTEGKVAWTKTTDLKEFEAKSSTPPSQNKSPDYKGKDFAVNLSYVSPNGELFIGGQKYDLKQTNKGVPNEAPTYKLVYKDLVLFHFNEQGELKAQYGIKRDKNNKWAKATMTPQELAISKDGNTVYWTYGEIKGMRQGFELFGSDGSSMATISKRKLLYYPTVARIDLAAGTIGDFVPLGADAAGKQLYYTNPGFSSVVSPDGDNVTFIGENKSGKILWLGRMIFE